MASTMDMPYSSEVESLLPKDQTCYKTSNGQHFPLSLTEHITYYSKKVYVLKDEYFYNRNIDKKTPIYTISDDYTFSTLSHFKDKKIVILLKNKTTNKYWMHFLERQGDNWNKKYVC